MARAESRAQRVKAKSTKSIFKPATVQENVSWAQSEKPNQEIRCIHCSVYVHSTWRNSILSNCKTNLTFSRAYDSGARHSQESSIMLAMDMVIAPGVQITVVCISTSRPGVWSFVTSCIFVSMPVPRGRPTRLIRAGCTMDFSIYVHVRAPTSSFNAIKAKSSIPSTISLLWLSTWSLVPFVARVHNGFFHLRACPCAHKFFQCD